MAQQDLINSCHPGKRQISALTPTGVTPNSKRPDLIKSFTRWKQDEKKFLCKLVTSSPGIEKVEWESVAQQVSETYGILRSAKACQNMYVRYTTFTQEKNEDKELQIEELHRPKEVATQTVMSIPPSFTVEWKCINLSSGHDPIRDIQVSSAEVDNDKSKPTKDVQEEETESKNFPDHSYSRQNNVRKKRKERAILKRAKTNAEISKSLSNSFSTTKSNGLVLSDEEKLNLKLALALTRDPNQIAGVILSQPVLKREIFNVICASVGERPQLMRNKVHGFVSVLMRKEPSDLENLNLQDILQEFQEQFPELLQMVMSIMIPREKRADKTHISQIVPRLALIYSVILQCRCHDLSRLQRVLGVSLADSISDQVVFDRLNRLGVVIPYCNTVRLIENLGQRYQSLIAKALQEDKYVRLIGDNLNFSVGTKQETITKHKHLEHMFLSTVLISEKLFKDLPSQPQIPLEQLTLDDILLNENEYMILRKDIGKLVADVISIYLPHLQFLKSTVTTTIRGNPSTTTSPTLVVPLPCLPFNEQSYKDDVKILDWYEDLLCRAVEESHIADGDKLKFQIGGDQLTRERLSEAKLLRLENRDPKDRFAHIGRCVTEFFHLGMNYLQKAIFGELWGEEGCSCEQGTLSGECERISRHSVDTNVAKAYDADKQFVQDYTSANIVAAAISFFGMGDINSHPTMNVPPPFSNSKEEEEWISSTLGKFIDEYVFPCWSGNNKIEAFQESVNEYPDNLELQLEDGTAIAIPIDVKTHITMRQMEEDRVKNYHHCILETGLVFKYFLQLMKSPDRDRLLAILKMMMLQLRGRSSKAKYPREILRILVQQYCIMGHQEACQVMQSSFVNLSGKPDSCIPADLLQEWNVKESKSYIKHMFANKTTANILHKTAALPSIDKIAKNYDKQTGALVRAKRHTIKENEEDVKIMIEDLQRIKPFDKKEGRSYSKFKFISKSPVEKVDGNLLQTWFDRNKLFFNE